MSLIDASAKQGGGKKTLMLTATLAGILIIPVVVASKLFKHLYVFYILGKLSIE